MGEAADLSAVVVDDERLAGEGRIDESRQDHAVGPGLPRADDVEEAADDDGRPNWREQAQRQEFVDRFAGAIRPAGTGRRAEDEVVVLGPGFFRDFCHRLRWCWPGRI